MQGTYQCYVVIFLKNYFICKPFYKKKIEKNTYVEGKIFRKKRINCDTEISVYPLC